MKKFRCVHKDLAVDVFYNPSVIVRKNAIFVSGFPAFPAQNELIEKVSDLGYVVYCPHYYGAFDSNGIFSFKTMTKTITDTELLLSSAINGAKPDFVKPEEEHCSLLIGQSFGGIAAAYSANELRRLEKLLIISSGLLYSTPDNDTGLNEDLNIHLSMVREKWRNTYRIAPDAEWIQISSGTPPRAPEKYNHKDLLVSLLIGEKDGYFDSEKMFLTNEKVCRTLLGDEITINKILVPNAGHPVSDIYMNLPLNYFDNYKVG